MFLLNIIILNFDIYLKTSKKESLLKAGFTCDEVEIGVVNRVVVGSYESSHLKVYVNRDN